MSLHDQMKVVEALIKEVKDDSIRDIWLSVVRQYGALAVLDADETSKMRTFTASMIKNLNRLLAPVHTISPNLKDAIKTLISLLPRLVPAESDSASKSTTKYRI
jgi:hypothetical protein